MSMTRQQYLRLKTFLAVVILAGGVMSCGHPEPLPVTPLVSSPTSESVALGERYPSPTLPPETVEPSPIPVSTSTLMSTFTWTPTPQKFFKGFDMSRDEWTVFVVNGKNSVIASDDIGASVTIKDDLLVFDLPWQFLWAYAVLDSYTYDDVHVSVVAYNRGTNNNNISLVCRYSEEYGWYEFNISNSGLYYIYHAYPRFDGFVVYNLIADGGSTRIKQGKVANEYAITCDGEKLTLFINGELEREVQEDEYGLRDGKIAISVSSFFSTPVLVEFDHLEVRHP